MKHKLISLFVLLALLLAGMPVQPARAAGATLYVDADVHCSFDCGGSWAAAYHDLQDALAAAVSTDQVWVAEGVYYPGSAGDRTATFTLKTGVAIYGGFDGTETRLSDRDIAANPTILSGDIDKNDVNTDGNFIAETTADIVGDNAYHVVTGNSGTDNTAMLDGFIITAGKADDSTSPNEDGGGLYNDHSSPTLMNLTLNGNYAIDDGGGMYTYYSSPILTNLTFSGNYAADDGGGLKIGYGDPVLTQITFSDNYADGNGGGMSDTGSDSTLANITFANNRANYYGGGLYLYYSDLTLTNVTFNSNEAITQSGGGMSNNGGAPHLTNVRFEYNDAKQGGGMYNNASAISYLDGVTFINNTAGQGGGIYNYNSNPTVSNSLFAGNSALGGGIYNYNSSPIITNTTISGNTGTYGGIYNVINSLPTLSYVTISDNSSGMYNSAESHPILHGVLIANNTNGDCDNEAGGYLEATSSHNLVEDSAHACGLTNGANGNIVGRDPVLGALADNGGDTLTHALLATSPAIDAGEDVFCPAADQRGVARPVGLTCDIGAFEEAEPHPYIVSITRADTNATTAASVDFNITFSEPVDNVHDYDFQVTATGTISGAEVTGITGDTTSGVVTVSTGTGSGTIRLDIPDGVGIVDADDNLLSGLPYTSGESYSVRPQTFSDVPMGYWAWNFIERLSLAGITGGCGGGNYCPEATVTRAQMAVFLLVAEHGTGYTPPAATGVFADVPASDPFAKWIEQLAAEGITGGCGGGNYCPNQAVTREQMAVFLLVAEHGSGYIPPAATGIFNDVPADNGFAKWIEALAAEGITGGCGGGNFCPKTAVNRAQMAIFLVIAFDLP